MIAEASETIKSKQQRKFDKEEGKQSCPVDKVVLKNEILTPIYKKLSQYKSVLWQSLAFVWSTQWGWLRYHYSLCILILSCLWRQSCATCNTLQQAKCLHKWHVVHLSCLSRQHIACKLQHSSTSKVFAQTYVVHRSCLSCLFCQHGSMLHRG